ncbi:MAG: hypothetical protein N2442_00405 [Spirochaetes bacterium]|nr:hypothetical protein [Spirochaetota bacterium]
MGKEPRKKKIEIPPYLEGYILEMDIRSIIDIPYLHVKTLEGDDLFFTDHGVPYMKHLLPRNLVRDNLWFQSHRITLEGSSVPYKVTTKEFDGVAIDIVFKWNRMGMKTYVPYTTQQFNTPFEEFALADELRKTSTIGTQNPLAIYVPSDRYTLEALQRRKYLMEHYLLSHWEAEMDMHRQYAVMYQWIPGKNLLELVESDEVDRQEAEKFSDQLKGILFEAGFDVVDHKLCHIILTNGNESPTKLTFKGRNVSLVDYELLYRNSNNTKAKQAERRSRYYYRKNSRFQPDRMESEKTGAIYRTTIMGVPYVCGEVPSTGGYLWVTGNDFELFDYFYPEKWFNLSRSSDVTLDQRLFRTKTADGLDILWRKSRVGEHPVIEPYHAESQELLKNGYNSPFQEFSIAMELKSLGIDCLAPLAIYMTGEKPSLTIHPYDESKYKSHASLLTREGNPILRKNHEYFMLWDLDTENSDQVEVIDALQAFYLSLIQEEAYYSLIRFLNMQLQKKGMQDHHLVGQHVLLFLSDTRTIQKTEEGIPKVRLCNFEFMTRRYTVTHQKNTFDHDRYIFIG